MAGRPFVLKEGRVTVYALLLTVLELAAPGLDRADDVIGGGRRLGLAGQVVVLGNEATGIGDITDSILIYSGDYLRPWRLWASESLLLCRHHARFDLLQGKRPRIRVGEDPEKSGVRDVIIEFPERAAAGLTPMKM